MKDKKFLQLLENQKTVLIICSRPLDFDSIASGLILKKYLEFLGKRVRLFFPTQFKPEEKAYYRFFPFYEEVEDHDTREILKKKNFDLLVLVDGTNIIQFYDTSITDKNPPDLTVYNKIVHIDHHFGSGEKLGTYTIHDPKASATAEVILDKIIPEKFIDEDIATLGYAAIVQDTGNFKWNFGPSSLRTAGLLMQKGARHLEVVEKMFFSKSRSYLEMLSFAIQNTEYNSRLRTTFLFMPYEKLKHEKIDGAKLVDLKLAFSDEIAWAVQGYDRGVIFYEKEPGRISVSIRGSNFCNKVNLPKMLAELGANGGGHFHAAGGLIRGDFNKVKQKLVRLLSKKLQEVN